MLQESWGLTIRIICAQMEGRGRDVVTINERIAICIEKSGLTKTAFAERINLSQPHISKLANGTSAPSDRTIADICREFGISERCWLLFFDQPVLALYHQNIILGAPNASRAVFTIFSECCTFL